MHFISGIDPTYWLIFLASAAISWLIQARLKSKFKEYGAIPLHNGMSGREIAQKMLRDNGIYDVQVQSVPGQLTDHYNPESKVVNLSPEVYDGRSIASAAVAAHECGHAVQHANAYQWLTLRSKLVPVVNIASQWMHWLMLISFLALRFSPIPMIIAIVFYSIITIFSFVTLPVEFDASRRGLAWLDSTRITVGEEHDKAKDALKWAAYTYVAAALSSLAMLLYYVMRFNRRR